MTGKQLLTELLKERNDEKARQIIVDNGDGLYTVSDTKIDEENNQLILVLGGLWEPEEAEEV